VLFGTVSIGLSLTCETFESEPQKWSHLSMDKNFGGIAVVHTETHILSDPTLALEDVDMTLDT
jgi:hypothetical protein